MSTVLSRPYLVLTAILLFATFWLMRNISQPWNGLDSSSNAYLSAIARNYNRYGAWSLKFGQATNPERVKDFDNLIFYQHHPPLPTLLIAFSFSVFGEREAAARMVPVILSLGSILLVFAITNRIYGRLLALMMTFIFSTLPGVLFFGRMPGYETPTLFFILLALWFYLRYLDEPRPRWIAGMYVAVVLGLLSDWPAFLLIPLLTLHCWFSCLHRHSRATIAISLPVVAIAVFALFAVSSYLADPNSLRSLLNQGYTYMGLISPQSKLAERYTEAKITFSALQYGVRALARLDLLFGYPFLILALMGLWAQRIERRPQHTIIFLIFGVALLYCVVFYRSVYIHYWHTIYFAVPVAVLSMLGLRWVLAPGTNNSEIEQRFVRPAVVVTVVALAIGGMLPRLWSLHSIQAKVLPISYPERGTFPKTLGLKIAQLSPDNDLIFTNVRRLAENEVAYYASRRIIWEVRSVEELEQHLQRLPPAAGANFLMWSQPEPAGSEPLAGYLAKSRESIELEVEDYKFHWFSLKNNNVHSTEVTVRQ